MNNKGQATIGISIVVAIFLFIVGMTVVSLITPEVTRARGNTALDCTNSSISDGTKLTCLAVDIVVPYFFVLVFAISGGLITNKFMGGRRK